MRKKRILAGILAMLLTLSLAGTAPAETGEQAADNASGKQKGFTIEGDVLVKCEKTDEKVTVPDGIREIGAKAFKGLETLEKVVLPDSVEKIGKNAFADCKNLKKVVLTENSRLKEIKSKAFLNCAKLSSSFVPDGVKVASDAFQGAKDAPADPATEEPETPSTPKPPSGGGGGGGGGGGYKYGIIHTPNTVPAGPDYDLIDVSDAAENGTAMQQLTLGDETLPLTLTQENEENRGFTVRTMRWQENGEQAAGEADTLVLTAAETEKDGKSTWKLNGEVLRRMYKSGITHLVLQVGEKIVAVETKGILAGWGYDRLKNQGTANRRFDYEIEMEEESPAVWRVQVLGEAYTLAADEHAAIYLKGTYEGPAETLEQPYDQIMNQKTKKGG